MDLKSHIRTIDDYPQAGIRFRDITPLLHDGNSLRYTIDRLYHRYQNTALDGVVAIDSRGFLFGSPLAYLLGVPLIPVRKQGKLPFNTIDVEYEMEYGLSRLEMHTDALDDGSKVIIVDDLIATGGTLCAAIELIEKIGAELIECAVVIELTDLGGREKIAPSDLFSLITFREDEA